MCELLMFDLLKNRAMEGKYLTLDYTGKEHHPD